MEKIMRFIQRNGFTPLKTESFIKLEVRSLPALLPQIQFRYPVSGSNMPWTWTGYPVSDGHWHDTGIIKNLA